MRSLALVLLFLLFQVPSQAQGRAPSPPGSKVLFRIGKADGDTRDLALGPGEIGKYRFPGYFVPGWSDPRRDWPYVHPGPLDPFGHKPFSTFTIAFGISALPSEGECRLVIDLVDTQDKFPPVLAVRVNGHPFRLEFPKGHGEPTLSGHPELGKRQTFTVRFPVTFLRKGPNEITLTSVKGCWFLYDALRLEVPREVKPAPLTRTLVYDLYAPPALVRKEGRLFQVLQAQVRRLGPPAPCRVLLDGKAAARISLETGWNSLAVPIPPVKKNRRALVELVLGGERVARARVEIRPVPRWTIYLVPHSHVDIGYTDRQDVVEKKHWRNIDQALELFEKTASYPAGARFKWDCESTWGVDSYFGFARKEKRERLLAAIRRGDLEVGALFANELTGICSREELFRMTEWSRGFRRKYGLRLDTALITDVPGWTWGVVPALARCGIKYFSCGPNRMARIGYTLARWGDRPFWWISPSGEEKVLCWVAGQGYSWFHHDGSLRTDKTFHYLEKLQERGYPYDMIQVRYTSGGDNGPPNPTLPDQVRKWNEKYVYPRYVLSTAGEMMRLFAKKYGRKIPSIEGDFTPYWEDGAASTARETALNRETKEKLLRAEALWAMLKPSFHPAKAFRAAWRYALLFDEHTWGAWCSVSRPDSPFTRDQWETKKLYGKQANLLADRLEKLALGEAGPPRPSEFLQVLNPLSFPRSDPVLLEPARAGGFQGVLDARGNPCPAQRLRDGSLAFLPGTIPPFASRVYRLVKEPTPWTGPPAAAKGSALSNGLVRIELDPATGALASYRWQEKELVKKAGGAAGWNDYLYVAGRDPSRAARNGKPSIEVEEPGPLLASLRVTSKAPGCRSLSRRILLFAGSPAVEIRDLLDKEKVRSKEGVHIAFPLAVPGGTLRINIPWAVIRPGKGQLEGACKNFFCVERWVDVSNQSFGLTWVTRDAPLVEIGAITAERPWLKRIRPSTTFYSYVMNNYWDTNYKADQEGKALFRYLLAPHGPYDPAGAERLALAFCRPLVVRAGREATKPLASLLQVEPGGIVVTVLRPTRDKKGLFFRLFNTTPSPARVRLAWKARRPSRVLLSDPGEDPLEPLPADFVIPGWGIRSVRAEFEGR